MLADSSAPKHGASGNREIAIPGGVDEHGHAKGLVVSKPTTSPASWGRPGGNAMADRQEEATNGVPDAEYLDSRSVLLASSGRAAEIPESADIYGWLVGSWELDIRVYWGIDVSGRALKGEAHFGWALEGRAIQDVWIMPKVADRTGWSDKKMNMYGTTLRVWDPSLQAWQITWTNPAGDHHERQIGRRIGQDVVQIGTRPDGTPTRWTFSEIAADSFHCTGEARNPDGRTETRGRLRGRGCGSGTSPTTETFDRPRRGDVTSDDGRSTVFFRIRH